MGTPPIAARASAISVKVVAARSSVAKATNRHREYASTAQNRCRPGAQGGPVDDQVFTRCPHGGTATAVIVFAPLGSLVGDEAAEVAVRAGVSGGRGDGEQAFGGDSAAGRGDAFCDDLGDGVVVAGAGLSWGRGVAGFESFDDTADGFVGGAAHLGGASVGADLAVGGNDVHAVLRRLQWNSLGGDR